MRKTDYMRDNFSSIVSAVYCRKTPWWRISHSNAILWFREERDEFIRNPTIDELMDVLFIDTLGLVFYQQVNDLRFIRTHYARRPLIAQNDIRLWMKKQKKRRRIVDSAIFYHFLFNLRLNSIYCNSFQF